LSIVPITASISYNFLRESSFSPYIGAGIGVYYINESDPNYTYLQSTKFGKHVFVGADLYLDRNTILKAELRQSFIDPVNSADYFQASLGGITATINIAMEIPLFGKQSSILTQTNYDETQTIPKHLNEIDYYYDQQNWNRNIYTPWNAPYTYINIIQPTQQQIDEQKATEKKYQVEQEQKRTEYLKQKQQLRQQKKDSISTL